MANVRVAVRVRPLSKRETKEGGRIIVEVDDKVAKVRNVKVSSRPESFGDSREKVVAFGFDYCYWSVNPEDPHYASQEVVFQDLGIEVLSGAAKGYNICLFAYGQTGSGKTYTMLGTPASVGLTPRICEGLFIREDDCASLPSSCSVKVSFLEIYNERVRDLLKRSSQNKSYGLRVREHPEMGPYVQGLSQHVVTNYQQVIQLLEEGIANRRNSLASAMLPLQSKKEGTTKIGRIDSDQEQDIVLQGQWIEREHCTITSTCGVVILWPTQGARCTVNGREVTASCRLTQGAVLTLGKAHKFRFNHPAEAALLRLHRLKVGEAVGSSGSLEWLGLDGDVTASRLGLCPVLWKGRKVLEEERDKDQQTSRSGETSPRAQTEQQQCYVEGLRQQAIEGQSGVQKEPELDQTQSSQQIRANQQWLLREETWLACLQETQQEEGSGEEKELEAFVAPDAWLPTVPQTSPSPLVQSQKRVVRLQRLRRRTAWATVWNIRQKKISFQLERIIKKQRLLKTQRRLEQLRALFGLQDDGASKAPRWVFSSNTSGPGSERRSRWTTCSSLSLQRLCSHRLSQLRSAFLNWDPSTMSPPVPDPTHQIPEKTLSADSIPQATASPPRTGRLGRNGLHPSGWRKLYPSKGASTRRGVSTQSTCLTVSHEPVTSQETKSLGKQPCQMSTQGSVTKKLRPRGGPRPHTPAAQTGRTKGLAASGNTQTGWQRERSCGASTAPKEAISHSTYLSGSKQAAGHGKVGKSFQADSKPPSLSRASKKHPRVPAARARDIARKFSHLPHGSPFKRQHSTGDPDTLALFTDSRPIMGLVREKDDGLSDSGSSYSVDSLSYACAQVPKELLKPEDLQGKWDLPDPENSESDSSQLSEDSLAEKGYQSPPENSVDEYSTMNHGHSGTRVSVSVRRLPKPSDSSSLCTRAHRNFSLDSLIDAEELGEARQKEPFLGSADEMPTETFWHLQKADLPSVDQEAMCRSSPINHRTGVRQNAFLLESNSFYLDPQFHPHCEQSELEMGASYCEQANSLQGVQLARESPLVSVDSWFSCDSKVNPSSPSMTVHSLCPSPDVHEIQPHDEMPRHGLNVEEVKLPGTVLPHSRKLPQDSAEPPCHSDLHTTFASDTSKPSVCGSQRLLQPEVDGVFRGKEIPDTTYQGISEESHNSDLSSVLAPSATSLTHVDSILEKNWAALQQKYLLGLSNSVLEAVGEPRPAFSFLEEDSSSLAEASDKVETQLSVGPGVSKNLDFRYFTIHPSTIRHFRAEKDHDSLSANLESASDLFSTIEKVSYNGAYSADLESLASGSINAQTCTVGNKIPNSMTEAWEVNQASLEGCLQGSRSPGLITSSGQYFFQKKAYHSHDTLATKANYWPRKQTIGPLRKSSAVQPRLLSHNSHQRPLLEEKADSQQHAKEADGTCTDASGPFPPGPELFLHSEPWSPFPSSLQPPPLETFYVTKSRDALTETALEIPACREAWVPSPPPREAWGFGHSYQVLQKAHWKNNLPKLSQSQNSKIDSSQQVTTKRPTDLNTGDVTEEMEKCSRNMSEEGNHDSAYCFVTQNRHHFPSTSLKVCKCGNQLGFLNKKYSLSVHKAGEGASAWHHCSVAFDGSESNTLLLICDTKASEEEQSPLPPHIQACGVHSQPSSGARSEFIGKITNLDLERVTPEEITVSLKSSSLHCPVSSPMIMAGGGSPTHRWDGGNETLLLRETISKDIQEEFSLPGSQYTCERCHLVMCSQEKKPIECKTCGQSQEKKSKEELLGEKQNKRVNNADEMAKLIRSVMQLETDILEIESKNNKLLHASQTPSTDFMLQALRDQERADHVLMPGSSGKHLFFEDQPSFPIQIEDGIFGDSEAREMEYNNAISNNSQVQKIIGSPFRSKGYAQERQSECEHSSPSPGLDGLARDTCDSLGKDIAVRQSSNISLHSRRMEALLARALPLQPSVMSSPEKDAELLNASADFQDQDWTLENLKEPETMESFQESHIIDLLNDSELEDTKAQRRVKELAVEQGENQQEENMVSLTQKPPTPSQHCKGIFFSQETVSPSHNQTDFSAALPFGELSGTQPLQSPSLPRSCLHASDTKGISSFEYMLEPTMLKINRSSLATGVGHQDYSGEARSSSPQGSVTGHASAAHTAWCESVIPTVMRAKDQSVTPESTLLETGDWVTVSTGPQEDQRGLVPSTGLTTQEGLGSESEATVQKEIKTSSLNRVSRQAEKRVSFLLQEDSEQGEEERPKAERKSKDQQPASSACLASLSLLRAPDPEPVLLPDSSIHASICLAILAEIRQAKAQRRQLNDFVAEGTVLPYETSQEECFPKAAGGPREQRVKLGWDSTRNEEEEQRPHTAPPSAVSAERKAQAMPPSAGGSQHLPHPETDRGPWHHLLASSHIVPDLEKKHCSGEPKQFGGAGGWSDSSEVMEKKKETSRTLSSVGPLASDRLLSTTAVEQDGRGGSDKVSVLSSQTSCDDPGRILHGQSQLATWKTAESMSFGRQDSIPEDKEPRSLDSTCGGGSGKILVATQEGKAVHSECQSVICNVDNSAGLSGPKQDHVQCSNASAALEEMKASPKPCAVQPGAPRKVEAEAHMWHPVKWKNVDSGLAEACEADRSNSRSTPLLVQRPSLHLSGVRVEAPGLCPKECFVSEGSTGGSRPLGSSYEEEENRTVPWPRLSGSRAPAVHACCSSTLPCYRDGVLREGAPQAAGHPVHSPFLVPSRACEVDGTAESFSKDSQVSLAHDLEHKHVNVEFGPGDSSIPNPSTAAAISSPAQSCSSLSTSEVKANCLFHTVAGRRSAEGSEKKTSGKKASTAPEDAYPSSPAGTHSEPLRILKDNSVEEDAQASKTKPEPPVVMKGPHTLNLNEGSVDGKLVIAAQYGHLENTTRCCSEKTQSSIEVRSHSCLGPQANFIDRLKHTRYPPVETLWEEEERDQTSGGGKDHAQVRNLASSNEGGFGGSHPRAGGREGIVVTKSLGSQTVFPDLEDPASLPLGQTETSQPAAQTPGQLSSGREQPALCHRHSVPVIAVFSGPKHAGYSPRPQFSVVSSSQSFQELNLSVASPPTDEDAQGPKSLWSLHLRGHSSEKPMSVPPKTPDCNQKASCNLNNSPTDHRPPKPGIPPYPTSSTVYCMPTPDFMTNWMPGTLERAQQEKTDKLSVQGMPENQHSQVDEEMLHFGSSDINPYILPWRPQGPVQIGWKQYVFGSAGDVSYSQKPQRLIPSNTPQCSSMDNALDDKKPPFHSHLRTYAPNQDLPNIPNSLENDQSSKEGWGIRSSSLAVEKPHDLTGSEGVAPTWDPDKRSPLKDSSEEIGCLQSELSLAEGSATAPGDETGCAVRQARMNTFEQGTQTLGSNWSCTDFSAQPDARSVSDSDLASWASMHNLSLHLSQLLHSTSELLGSLSQPSVVLKEQNIKSNSLDEAPQALMIDSSTQTTVDEGIQTDLALHPLPFQAPEVKPQEVNVILEVMDSGVTTMVQEKGYVSGVFQKKGAEETEPPDHHEGSTHYKLQRPPVASSHLRFQKVHLGQNLTFVSPPASPDGSPPPSLRPEESSMVVNSSSISHHSGLFLGASEFAQKKLGSSSALLVDRASSPILTFSASTQELSNPLDCLTLSAPSAHPLEDFQEIDISPNLAVGNPRPLMDNSQAINEFAVIQRAESLDRGGKSPLEKSSEGSFDSSSPCSPQQSSSLQVSFLGQAPLQLQPRSTTGDQSRLPSPRPSRHKSLKLADSFVPEKVASIEHGPRSSRRPSQWQGRTASEKESSVLIVEPQPSLDLSSSWRGLQPLSPCPVSDTAGPRSPAVEPPQACQPVELLCPDSHVCVAPDLQHQSLRDLPVHNKFDNWYGVRDGSCGELHVRENGGVGFDSSSVDQTQRPLQSSDDNSQNPVWPRLMHIPLQVGIQKPSLSVELAEAKLHRGFGETDALLKVLQNGTGEVIAPQEPAPSSWEERSTRQKKTIETLRRERAERLHNFRRTRSLSPQKQFSFLPSKDLPTWELDLPSRRREYLQQLRKDVVGTTRIPEPASRSAHPPSDIELMLQDYHQAREEAKVEIAQSQDRLRERTEQEKLRIRRQIISQLLKEEEKLQTLANSSSLCTSSDGSLSSGITSGYNSSPAFSGHLQSLEVKEDARVPDFQETWTGDWRGRSTVRNSQLYLTGSAWKSLAYSRRASLGSGGCSPSSLSSLGTCFSSLYQDLAKHIVNTSMADVMAACSDNLHNLFSRQATAGWNYQGEEQEVQLYYKEFSSTRHGFLGAGVVSQPLSHVWAAVSDPTLWPLYHKPIHTARLHQRVSNSISLVYLVCDTTLCALKQLRDFCCVCVEAKEGHLSIMAAQSVYDTSMPRPSRKMVRGEILPSAWVLQPAIMEGKEITRVIFLAQVELGAPGFPPHLLNSFIKQQPLVVAKLASFLGS
ncbi:stAR-related lipid transfer protein 9 [Onychomys torridus]|uniref:stAR-related lipid transfer protein 9 n=1 Tax=Onychomys torridus TaxID=38674 RepID=UPI00167F7B2B|nr:stAR-related lipid transfer protein 9 [Onychomys torridus]